MEEIKVLKNGMVVLDNGTEVLQANAELITNVRIFPPEENNPCFGDKFNHWRVQVSGADIGYIVFPTETRDGALEIQRRITEALGGL